MAQVDEFENLKLLEEQDEHTFEKALITEVQKYPVLWDRSKRDYGHFEKCSVVWAVIGQTLGKEIAECLDRWKNLRDSYVRRLKAVKRVASHGLTPRKPRWQYFEQMQFLENHVEHRFPVVGKESSKSLTDIEFYDDGRSQAPNRNSLGGLYSKKKNKGPTKVNLSKLPAEPVATFSRIAAGQIVVVEEEESCDENVDEPEPSHSATGHSPTGHSTTGHSTTGHSTTGHPVGVLEINAEASLPTAATLVIVKKEMPDYMEKPVATLNGKGHHHLRPNRRRSYRHFDGDSDLSLTIAPIISPIIAPNMVPNIALIRSQNDDASKIITTTLAAGIEAEILASPPAKKKRTESSIDGLRRVEEALRIGFIDVKSQLAKLEIGEEAAFAQTVCGTLERLPLQARALAKLKIQQLLYDVETDVLEDAIEATEARIGTVLTADGETELMMCVETPGHGMAGGS